MTTLKYTLATDRSSVSLEMPSVTISLSASELEELMRTLAVMRANLLPSVPDEALSPGTLYSIVPATRWHVTQDELPTQIRLFLLHQGFGWIWMPLSRKSVRELTEGMERGLQSLPKLQ